MNKRVFFIAFFAVIGWASGFAGIGASLRAGFSPGHLVLYRFLIASILFFLYAMLPRSNFKLPKKEDLLLIFGLGIAGITFYHLGVTFGQQTVSAGTASMVVGSAPIFTTLIAVFILKEKMERFGWIGLGIGFIGVIIITIGSTGFTLTLSTGLLFVLFATISTSFFFVYQKPLLSRYNPVQLTAMFTWAGTVPMLIYLPGLFENIQTVTLEANLAALYVGVVPATLCYAAWAIALSHGEVSTVSSMLYLEPPIAIIIAWFWLNELPSTLSMIGGFIAISSVAIVNIIGHRKRRLEETVHNL